MTDDVTVRLTEDGPTRMRGNGVHWERGGTREVSLDHAEALLEAHDFIEIVDDGPEICDEIKSDGEVCGRDLPCSYHTDEDDDGD